MSRASLWIVAALVLTSGCASAPEDDADTVAPAVGKTFASADDAPAYDGSAFRAMKVLDLEHDRYLDEAALLSALDPEQLVFFGEQHATAPVQELELWLLQRMTARHGDVALGMEHFQRDEQPVIDRYLAGQITSDEFERTAQPWPEYATYWKPLVEHMRAAGRPVLALNVPNEALQSIYAAYPRRPLQVFDTWSPLATLASSLAPRPLPPASTDYGAYFRESFDYAAHFMGLSYDDALAYFTELAVIRDQNMAYFMARHLETGGRVLTVAGDWHVQTGLATPDRAAAYVGNAIGYALITTTPRDRLEEVRARSVAGRKLARFVLVYERP